MRQFLIAVDQAVNTLVWSQAEGWGFADETLSARAHRMASDYPATWGRFRALVNRLFHWQVDHCYAAYLSEKKRRQFPKEYRNV